MRLGEEFSIEKDWAFYDSGIAAVLGAPTIFCYEVLRRLVFHPMSRSRASKQYSSNGYMVASVCLEDLVAYTGFDPEQIKKSLTLLKSVDWIHEVLEPKTAETCFLLGNHVEVSERWKYPAFWADGWLQELWKWLQNKACAQFEAPSLPYEEGEGEELDQQNALVLSTSYEWRRTQVEAFIEDHQLRRDQALSSDGVGQQ